MKFVNRGVFKTLSFLIFFSLGYSCSHAKVPDEQYNEILQRLADLANEHPTDSAVEDAIYLMTEEGTYNDVDYSVTTQGTIRGWIPKWHLYRLVTIASAYSDHNSKYYKSSEVLGKIELGLRAWILKEPKSSNWWVGTIHEPQKLGCILVLVKSAGGAINEEIESKIINIMEKAASSPYDYNDANRIDVALHWVYRACLEKDEETMTTAVNSIYGLLDIGETGFQVDGSFFHDGPQFFIGGYCVMSVASVVDIVDVMRNTSFGLSGNRLELLRDFFLKTWVSAARGGYINYDCYGRAISQEGIYYDVDDCYKKMAIIDKDYCSYYLNALSSLKGNFGILKTRHHHFFRGDYTTYSCPSYNYSVRLFSSRTQQLESGNDANLQGYFLCFGNTSLTMSGREYYNVHGLWDWNYIPGVTAPLLEKVPSPRHNWGVKGTSTFAGGVSDSIRGVTTFSYYDNYNGMNTGGNKGWFFFGDEVVCLGSHIQSDHQAVTTVEQCWGYDDWDKYEINGKACVYHHNVGYYFPSHSLSDLTLKNDLVTGNWHDINTTRKDTIISGRVFLLAINHDFLKPADHDYSYIIIPGLTEQEIKSYIERGDIDIVENNDSIQVVRHKGKRIWELIFYKGASFRHPELEISVSRPCAMIYKYNANGLPTLHISDPGQTGELFNIEIDDNYIKKHYTSSVGYEELNQDYYGMTMVASLKEIATDIQKNTGDLTNTTLSYFGLNGEKKGGMQKGVNIVRYKTKEKLYSKKIMSK